MDVSDDATWWCLKAGRGGVLEDDWLEQKIVTTGWGDAAGDFRNVTEEDFREADPSPHHQLSKFIGYDPEGMEEGDVVVVYAPQKGHLTGVGVVGEVDYDEGIEFHHLTDEQLQEYKVADHYYWRPVTWFDWGTPVLVSELPKRFQVQGKDQIPTPPTLNRYGTLEKDRERIESLEAAIKEAETVSDSAQGFRPKEEAQIQEWVVQNIKSLGFSNPRQEVRTSVGRIDVLAESDGGEVVIEIKRGRAGDRALGQLLGYMGARFSETSEHVEGVLVSERFTRRVREAAEVLDDVSLYEFSVEIGLSEA